MKSKKQIIFSAYSGQPSAIVETILPGLADNRVSDMATAVQRSMFNVKG